MGSTRRAPFTGDSASPFRSERTSASRQRCSADSQRDIAESTAPLRSQQSVATHRLNAVAAAACTMEAAACAMEGSVSNQIDDKVVLITGGTSSLGRALLTLLLADYAPKKIILFARDQDKLSQLQLQFTHQEYPSLRFFLGDVRDQQRLMEAFRGVDVVFHSDRLRKNAALEYNPQEAIKTNVDGSTNVITAAIERGCSHVVATSIDEACGPSSIFGATQLCADRIFVSGTQLGPDTRFCVARLPVPLGAEGSLVHHVMNQAHTDGAVQIGHDSMSRLYMSLEQAAKFLLSLLPQMRGGEIFAPIVPSYFLATLAQVVAPNCACKATGPQPGEAMHQSLLLTDELWSAERLPACIVVHPPWRHDTVGHSVPIHSSQSSSSWLDATQLEAAYRDWLEQDPIAAATGTVLLQRVDATEEAPDMALALDGGPKTRQVGLPYGKQTINHEDSAAVLDVLHSSYLTTGPQVAQFEAAVMEFTGAEHAVAVSNGTAALHCAVFALGISAGDEVIVPPLTFVATANAVIYQGGTVVFADIDPDTLCIDPLSVQKLITERTKAVIAVDYGGLPADYAALKALCAPRGVALVADASHSIGATQDGTSVGSGALCDITTFSFHPVKNMTTGEGGMVVTNNAQYADRARRFRTHGISSDWKARQAAVSAAQSCQYQMVDLGFNYRITDIQCALGSSQLSRLGSFIARRQQIAAFYDAKFESLGAVQPQKISRGSTSAYHLYVIRLDHSALSVNRDKFFEALKAEGIGCSLHYPPVHLHPYYRQTFGCEEGLCPIVEEAFHRIITLPLFPKMEQQDVLDVVNAVAKVHNAYFVPN